MAIRTTTHLHTRAVWGLWSGSSHIQMTASSKEQGSVQLDCLTQQQTPMGVLTHHIPSQLGAIHQSSTAVQHGCMKPGAFPHPLGWRRVFVCRELGARGVKAMLAVPVSFVSEHIETLEEIDMEYRELVGS